MIKKFNIYIPILLLSFIAVNSAFSDEKIEETNVTDRQIEESNMTDKPSDIKINKLEGLSFRERLNHVFDSNPEYNPIFHGHKHSVEIDLARSYMDYYNGNKFDAGYYALFGRYSIPMHLLIHGRTSLEFGGILGTAPGGNVNQVYGGLMHEFVFDWKYFYSTVGVGMAYRDIYNGMNNYDGINSRLVAAIRIGLGMNITENINVEVFFKHFSNGELQQPNNGYNFFGLSVGWLL